MTRGTLFADHAESWIDVPFMSPGCVRAGADCKGWIAGAARELGFPEGDSIHALAADYGVTIPVTRLRAGLAELFDRVRDRQPGDILLLVVGGKAQHLAVHAPREGKPTRVIEAMHVGPQKVRPFRRADSEVDSIWRWREADHAA